MKKTLVAVAALVVVGAVSAQSTVSITGNFGAAYTSTNDGAKAANSSASGFGVTDGKVVFKASEDLGGGLKAGVSMDVQVRGRRGAASATSNGGVTTTLSGVPSNSVDGRDATVYVSGGFGTVTLGAIDHYNTLIDLAIPMGGQGLDTGTAQFGGDGNVDLFSYTSPSMNGFTATVSMLDSIGAPAAGGMQSTSTLAAATELGLAYAQGPINAAFEYTSFSKKTSGTASDSRWRLSGNYDLGVATLGAGFSKTTGTTSLSETALGVKVPMGAMSFGLGYGKMVATTAAVDTTTSGWEAVAQYDLSKRTNVQVAYRSEDTGVAANDRSTAFRTRLLHSF